MNRFLLYVASFLFPVFGGLAAINYYVDPGHIYSSKYIDNVVEGLRQGKNVTNISDLDERIFMKRLIEVHKNQSFDYLIMGASRVMTISSDALTGANMLNLGVSGCKIEDLVALYELCKENGIHAKNIIIGVEPTFFNSNDRDSRWKSIAKYYYAFEGKEQSETNLSLVKNLFSPSYFKSSLMALPQVLRGESEIKYVDTYINDSGTKRTDGSIYYAKEYRDRPQIIIDEETKTWLHGSFKQISSLSDERKQIFISLIDAIRSEETMVMFFNCPYHPIFYRRIIDMKGVQKGVAYIQNYAKEKDIKIIGSFNPSDVSFKNSDFYDAAHVRKESIDKLFQQYISSIK